MRTLMVYIIVALLAVAGPAFAGQIGSCQPQQEEGAWSVGGGYLYEQTKIKADVLGETCNYKAKQNKIYTEVSRTFTSDIEAYVRLGGADMEIKNSWNGDFDDGYGLYGAVGINGLVHKTEGWGIGAFLQGSIYSDYKDTEASVEGKIKDLWDITLGVSCEVKMNQATIYGGPIFYWLKGKGSGSSSAAALSTDIKSKDNVGLFAGATMPLNDIYSINIELQYKSEVSAGLKVVAKI